MSLFKKCDICRYSLGIFTSKYAVKDGFVCDDCFIKSNIRLRRSDVRVSDIKSCLFGNTSTVKVKEGRPAQTSTKQPQNVAPRAIDFEKIAKAKERLKKYVVFDLETTGLDAKKHEIVEIGAVKVENGEIVDTFSTFVKPKKGMTEAATEVNGITDEMLADAPSINRVLPEFKKFIGSCTLVGHNAEFDCKFLYIACARFQMKLTNSYVDTLEMAQKAYPYMGNHKLGTLCNYLGIENETAHRALSDSQATQKVFCKLWDIVPPVTHKIKQYTDLKQYGSRPSDSTKNIIDLVNMIIALTDKGSVTDRDISLLTDWLGDHGDQAGEFPAYRLPAIIDNVDKQWQYEQLRSLTEITPTGTLAKHTDISGKTVVLSGEFREGSFEEVSRILESKGAVVKGNPVKKADYFVVGEYGSPDWSFGNYGGNYKKMMEYIGSGSETIVIKEKDFFKAI